ncbi:MAG: hypothetical protein ABIH23_32610 [bacterium]
MSIIPLVLFEILKRAGIGALVLVCTLGVVVLLFVIGGVTSGPHPSSRQSGNPPRLQFLDRQMRPRHSRRGPGHDR